MGIETRCYVDDQIKNYKEKFNPSHSVNFSENMYKILLCNSDRIQCVNRFIWYNLPSGFDGLDIETMLYNYGAICSFQIDDDIVFAPFSCVGKLNIKGEPDKIQPYSLDGITYPAKKRVYNNKCKFDFDESCAIIIADYTGFLDNNNIVSRSLINSATTINDEVKTYKILLYNIMLSIKKMLVTCESEEQVKVVMNQAKMLLDPTKPILALNKGWSVSNNLEITQFVDKIEVDELSRAIDFYNKVRRNNNGVPSPDTFEKKERMITDEIKNAGVYSNLILSDGLQNRQRAASYMNECFGTNIIVEINSEVEV